LENRSQRTLRLRQTHTGTHPADHLNPIAVLVDVFGPGIGSGTRGEHRVGVHRKIDVYGVARIHTKEARRGHSNDAERDVVQQDDLADCVSDLPKTAYRVIKACNRHGRRAKTIVGWA
jgi:hypothetical protein